MTTKAPDIVGILISFPGSQPFVDGRVPGEVETGQPSFWVLGVTQAGGTTYDGRHVYLHAVAPALSDTQSLLWKRPTAGQRADPIGHCFGLFHELLINLTVDDECRE